MTASRILILGGTTEARELAQALDAAGAMVVTSLAGRVAAPRAPAGELRVGGFGGAGGLERWLITHRVDTVVDATHPFATQIAAAACEACARTGAALLRLERPGWAARPGDRWHRVRDVGAAADAVAARPGRRVLLALGRQHLAPFAALDAWFLIRSISPPDGPLPPRRELAVDRGPFTLAGELDVLRCHRIDLVVARDSGGDGAAAKLAAARQLGTPVVMVDRPARPSATATETTVTAASEWALRHLATA
jgi:precorrin-6A/cobalt-precorrin-6A reductase